MSDADHERGPRTAPLASAFQRHRLQARPPRLALVGSILLHALLVAAAVTSANSKPATLPLNDFKVYKVELFSPPPQVEGPPTPPPPKPAIVRQPRPEPKPVPKPEPRNEAPRKEAPKVADARTEPPKKAEPVTGRNARPGPTGGEGLNILQEGEDFPYPEYLQNVIRQINRYFQWTGAGNLEAEVGFYIRRDGSVSGLRVFQRSGNTRFDLTAGDAVTFAGKNKAFGQLPEGFPRDSLGILLTFLPPNR